MKSISSKCLKGPYEQEIQVVDERVKGFFHYHMLNLTGGGLIIGCWTKINRHDSSAFLDLFNNELDADTGITFIKSKDKKMGKTANMLHLKMRILIN